MEGMKPVKIYSCADRVDADMITETLNDRGIPAYSESKGSGDYMNERSNPPAMLGRME